MIECKICVSCAAPFITVDETYGYGSIRRTCMCGAVMWGCPSCGQLSVERDGLRVCACGWSGRIPTLYNPASAMLELKGPPLPEMPRVVLELKRNAPTAEPKAPQRPGRKPRHTIVKAPKPGQTSLF